MRLSDVDALQAGIWGSDLSEPVEVVDEHGVTTWTGRGIANAPASVEAPGGELSYETAVDRLSFPRVARPHLPRGARLRWRGSIRVVGETFRRSDHVLIVTLSPA